MTMDLNDAAAELQVPKRRIYDITNVLESLGTIVKTNTNTVTYGGAKTSYVASQEIKAESAAISTLEAAEASLDAELNQLHEQIARVLPSNLYMTRADVLGANSLTNGPIILVRAPAGTQYDAALAAPNIPPTVPSTNTLTICHPQEPIEVQILHQTPQDHITGLPGTTPSPSTKRRKRGSTSKPPSALSSPSHILPMTPTSSSHTLFAAPWRSSPLSPSFSDAGPDHHVVPSRHFNLSFSPGPLSPVGHPQIHPDSSHPLSSPTRTDFAHSSMHSGSSSSPLSPSDFSSPTRHAHSSFEFSPPPSTADRHNYLPYFLSSPVPPSSSGWEFSNERGPFSPASPPMSRYFFQQSAGFGVEQHSIEESNGLEFQVPLRQFFDS